MSFETKKKVTPCESGLASAYLKVILQLDKFNITL